MVNKWLKIAQSVVFPPLCLLCGWPAGTGAVDLCPGCLADLPDNGHACPRCALALPAGIHGECGRCQSMPPAFQSSFVPWLYRSPLDYLLPRLKYAGDLTVARSLGLAFARRLSVGVPPDARLIPVPLHPRRLRQRGFNQSMELARTVGAELGLAVAEDGFGRLRDTPAQAGLSAAHRRRNLRGAFRYRGDLTGRAVILFDDVITTGSTVRAAALALRSAGAARVDVWAVARA